MSEVETFESIFRERFGRSPTEEEMLAMINQSVTSYNQSGGITAHTVNLGPKPRRLSNEQREILLQQLPNSGNISIEVMMGISDGHIFQSDFIDVFSRAGWQVATAIHAGFKNLGVSVRVTILEESSLTVAVIEALKSAKIDFDFQVQPRQSQSRHAVRIRMLHHGPDHAISLLVGPID
jgi:hypothetical protein